MSDAHACDGPNCDQWERTYPHRTFLTLYYRGRYPSGEWTLTTHWLDAGPWNPGYPATRYDFCSNQCMEAWLTEHPNHVHIHN